MINISYRQQEHFWPYFIWWCYSWLSYHVVFPRKPIIFFNVLVFDQASNNIRESKVRPFPDSYEPGILVLGQDVETLTFSEEVDASNFVTFLVDELIVSGNIRLKQRTNPGNKRLRLIMQEYYPLICFSMEVQWDFNFQLVW